MGNVVESFLAQVSWAFLRVARAHTVLACYRFVVFTHRPAYCYALMMLIESSLLTGSGRPKLDYRGELGLCHCACMFF